MTGQQPSPGSEPPGGPWPPYPGPAGAPAEPVWGAGEAPRRLDPRALVSRLIGLSALRQQWGLIVGVIAVLGVSRGSRALTAVGALLLVGAVTFGRAVVEWLVFSYAVADGRLVVRRGLLRRSLTVVPLDRIRGVDVHSSAVQRLLGIAVVRVDAAATGGRQDEAVLDAVSQPEAVRLRRLLLRDPSLADPAAGPRVDASGPPGGWPIRWPAPAVPAPEPAPGPAAEPEPDGGRAAQPGGPVPGPAVEPTVEPAVELARLRPHWLLYAPLVGSYLLAPVAAVAALQQYLDELHIPWFDRIADAVADRRPSPLLVAGAAVAVLLACAVGAVGTAAVANWGFRLTRRGGALVSERGLLSRRQVSLELDRVRGVTLAEPLSLRLVGAARLTALVTGLGGENTRRGQLLPLGPAGAASAVAAAVRPFGGRLRRHGPAALRRRLIRAVVPWLVLAAAAAALRWWWAAGAFGVLAAVGVPLALDRYRGLGHGLDDGALAVRSGSLRRRQATLDRRGVIGWQVRQTFFQRRAGLATVTVGTGAGGFDIIDVEVAEAVAVLAAVTPGPVAGLADPP